MLTSPGLKAFLTADILVVNRPTGAGPAAYLGKLVAWLSESRWQCLSRPNVQAIIIVVAAFQNNKNTAHNATDTDTILPSILILSKPSAPCRFLLEVESHKYL